MTCTGLSRTVTALNDEWSTLADEPAPLSWRAVPALPLGTLGDVLAGVRSAPDTVLLALLGLQAEGDALAGRVVLSGYRCGLYDRLFAGWQRVDRAALADGRALTKTAQVRMCGNSVCPPVARALVAANYAEAAAAERRVA